MNNSLDIARMRVLKYLPYCSQYLMSMIPVRMPGLGNFATDQRMRLFYDPQFFEEYMAEVAAGDIMRVMLKSVFKYPKRRQQCLGSHPGRWELELWTLAENLCCIAELSECRLPKIEDWVYPIEVFPDWKENNRSIEQVYSDLLFAFPGPQTGFYIVLETHLGHTGQIPAAQEAPFPTADAAHDLLDKFLVHTQHDLKSAIVVDQRFTVAVDRQGQEIEDVAQTR